VSQSRALAAEATGTALLLAVIVGSGIMGERLAGGNGAIALLANTLATGAGLAVLIATFGDISGAHFNPVVTISEAWLGRLTWRRVPAYLLAQVIGAVSGVALANAMFALPLFSESQHVRSGSAQLLSEGVATFGLLTVILHGAARRPGALPMLVGLYIGAGYWFTASTAFANPVVTIARSLSDTFAGIRPSDTPAFIAAQAAGGSLAMLVFRWMDPSEQSGHTPSR
jgi:glycerol uptake facilitator-like aquaporin